MILRMLIRTEWLRSKGVKAPIENMRIWDYDNPQPVREIGEYNRTVGLAGNLDKVQFFYTSCY